MGVQNDLSINGGGGTAQPLTPDTKTISSNVADFQKQLDDIIHPKETGTGSQFTGQMIDKLTGSSGGLPPLSKDQQTSFALMTQKGNDLLFGGVAPEMSSTGLFDKAIAAAKKMPDDPTSVAHQDAEMDPTAG